MRDAAPLYTMAHRGSWDPFDSLVYVDGEIRWYAIMSGGQDS